LNNEIEECKNKFHNLEKEKETGQKMMEKIERNRISAKEEMKAMKKTNENME